MTEADFFETERLVLEPLRAGHAEEMFAVAGDEKLYEFMLHEPPVSVEVLEARYRFLEERQRTPQTEAWLNWAIRLKETGHLIGRVEITLYKNQTAYLAYELASKHWGKGYATEACKGVLNLLADRYAVQEVTAEVDTRNTASIKLLERLGFERVSLKENADFFKGSRSDEFLYRLKLRAGQGTTDTP